MVYTLLFSSSKCSLFHNSIIFGSCIIRILYTGCAKTKKIIPGRQKFYLINTELNPICHLLALLGAHHILHVSGIRVKVCHALYKICQKCSKNNNNYQLTHSKWTFGSGNFLRCRFSRSKTMPIQYKNGDIFKYLRFLRPKFVWIKKLRLSIMWLCSLLSSGIQHLVVCKFEPHLRSTLLPTSDSSKLSVRL